jgi:hypothetical protein
MWGTSDRTSAPQAEVFFEVKTKKEDRDVNRELEVQGVWGQL